jgi:hypothetical protein
MSKSIQLLIGPTRTFFEVDQAAKIKLQPGKGMKNITHDVQVLCPDGKAMKKFRHCTTGLPK